MKKCSHKLLKAAALTLAMASLAACGGGASGSGTASNSTTAETSAAATGDTTVTIAISGAWDSLCPLASTSNNADAVTGMIFEPLLMSNGDGTFDGLLAESYEMSEDHTQLTFHLRQNVLWHDGEPMDADDVIFSARLYTNGDYTSSRRLFFQQVEGCENSGIETSEDSAAIEKIDQYTVRITYKQPISEAAAFAQQHTFRILPEHLLSDVNPADILTDDFWTHPIGTGAFMYESDVPGESLTGVAFDDYYMGRPGCDHLVMRLINATNAVTSMMTGDVDIISPFCGSINDADLDTAMSLDGYTVESVEGTGSQFLVLNNDVFSTPTIRKAIAMLLDKETMIQAAYQGRAAKAYTMYAQPSIWYDQAVVDELGYTYDPETAVQMLEDEEFDFDRTYTVAISDTPARQAMMTVMQNTWSQYGLKLEIRTMDTQTCISEIREGNVDMWVNGWSAMDTTTLNTVFLDWFMINDDGSYGTFNLARIDDPTLMNLEMELTSAVTDEEIQQVASELQRKVLTDYNYVWLVSQNVSYAVSDRIQGMDMNKMYAGCFDYWNWTVTA